jgi:hypothetical protein
MILLIGHGHFNTIQNCKMYYINYICLIMSIFIFYI